MSGYVYAIGIEGTTHVKIGHSTDPERRLAAMQVHQPFKLALLYSLEVERPRAVERALHAMLADSRGRGEWFEMPQRSWPDLFAAAVEQEYAVAPEEVTTLGKRVLLCRRDQRLSQQGLAEMAGLSANTIARLERGDIQKIYSDNLDRLAAALGVSTDFLLGRTPERVA